MSIRPVRQVIESRPTLEGAGVKLRRAFGFGNTTEFDPFLLFDDFRNEQPGDYLAGFPWHPHRGIETITYVLTGSVEHGDSLGNSGALGAGDVQWMTAGSGIMHQEMPRGDDRGRMHGFQLWANLPSSLKMTAPRYQDIHSANIPEIAEDDGTRVRVVCGDFWGRRGPVDGIAADPSYLDIWVPPNARRSFPIDTRRNAFAYIFEGDGTFRDASAPFGVLTEQMALHIAKKTVRGISHAEAKRAERASLFHGVGAQLQERSAADGDAEVLGGDVFERVGFVEDDGVVARDFIHSLGDIVAAPFELKLGGLASFGGRKPRAVFASVAPSEPLQALQRAHERAARAAGMPPEPRNYTPHVTVARLRGASSEAVAAYLERQGGFMNIPFEVSRFVLFSSRNSIGGGPYVVEAAYPLEG